MKAELRKKTDEALAQPAQHPLPEPPEQRELPPKHEQHGKHVLPVQHVHPMSDGHGNGQSEFPLSEGQKAELMAVARRNACIARHTASKRRWQLLRDLKAFEKAIGRSLTNSELAPVCAEWHRRSGPFLDPSKTQLDYMAAFLVERKKVRVPTGEGETLKKALEAVSRLSLDQLPMIPEVPNAPEPWRRIAALHQELSRRSANGTYFLSCRDAAKAHKGLTPQTAYNTTLALAELGVIEIVHRGRPGTKARKAAEFRYLLSETESADDEDSRLDL